MNTTSRLLAGPTLLALTLSLAACGSNDSGATPAPSADASSARPSAASEVSRQTISPPGLRTPPTLRGSAGAITDIDWDASTCHTEAGSQQVTGTVTNSTRSATDYLIVMNWVNATSDVRGNGVTVVRDLAPGQKADWSLRGKIAPGATACVPNVTRGTIAANG